METKVDNESKGKLIGCYFQSPDNQTEYPFLARDDGTIVANLEDYAIIPIKVWEELSGSRFVYEKSAEVIE